MLNPTSDKNFISDSCGARQFLLADDMLQGAEEIGAFMGLDPRQVYYQQKRLPVFKIGALICARKSTILKWISDQEAKATGAAA